MKTTISNLLSNPKFLLKKIKKNNLDLKQYSYSVAWNPLIRCDYKNFIETEDAFVSVLFLWLKVQKENANSINIENSKKKSIELLSDLFGTYVFSDLEIQEVETKEYFDKIGNHLVHDFTSEKLRLKELKSLKKSKIISIKSATGDILYFGKNDLFYFFISNTFLLGIELPIFKEINELLTHSDSCDSIRKRPGMYVGSVGKVGMYYMLFVLIEELLEHALEKNLTIKISYEGIFEITCESYFIKNNTSYFSYIPVVSALSETFVWLDEENEIKTEKGIITTISKNNEITNGVKIIYKLDVSIFDNINLDYFVILNRMIELAALNPYKISLENEQNHNIVFTSLGIESLFKSNNLSSSEVIHIDIFDNDFTGKIALSFSSIGYDIRKSYVNNQLTQDGGAHVKGVLKGVKKALKIILSCYEDNLSPDNFMDKLSYVVSIKIEEPRWHGSTKRKLKNLEVKIAFQEQVEEQLYAFLKNNIEPLEHIYSHCFKRKVMDSA